MTTTSEPCLHEWLIDLQNPSRCRKCGATADTKTLLANATAEPTETLESLRRERDEAFSAAKRASDRFDEVCTDNDQLTKERDIWETTAKTWGAHISREAELTSTNARLRGALDQAKAIVLRLAGTRSYMSVRALDGLREIAAPVEAALADTGPDLAAIAHTEDIEEWLCNLCETNDLSVAKEAILESLARGKVKR